MVQEMYQFAAKPNAVQARKKQEMIMSSNQKSNNQPVNIMVDKRVFRGNNFGKNRREIPVATDSKKKRVREMTKWGVGDAHANMNPVQGRRHMHVQTDTFLEELTDRVKEESMETQTEAFFDRPSKPLFVPKKSGSDVQTQVDVDELYDFDSEVEPLLDALVGKTLEHAMMEVLEEEEQAALMRHELEFKQARALQISEVQRMEAQARRREQEKERRIKQEQERNNEQAEIAEIVASRAFASDYVEKLSARLVDNMLDAGQLRDPFLEQIQGQFLPWLTTSIESSLEKRAEARQLASALVEYALRERSRVHLEQVQLNKASQHEQVVEQVEETPVEEENVQDESSADAPEETVE